MSITKSRQHHISLRRVTPFSGQFLFLVAVLIALTLTGLNNYPLFHSLAEMFCMIVAAVMFIIAFNTRRLSDNHYLLFVGIGSLAFVAIGVAHLFGYRGVQLFPGFDANLPTQAFIAQRAMLAISFLLAPLFVRRRLNVSLALSAFGAATLLALLSMLVWRTFPDMFIDGIGLTALKQVLDYALSTLFVVGAALLWAKRDAFEPIVWRFIIVVLGFLFASELMFTLYADPFGTANLAGHLFQVCAFWLLYRAVVVTALVDPFGLLFRELALREASASEMNRQLRAIVEISDAAISTLERDDLVDSLLRRLTNVMSADAAILFLADRDVLRFYAAVGVPLPSFELHLGEGLAGRIAQSRQAECVTDVMVEAELVHPWLREQGIRGVLGVPLLNDGELVGVLHIDWRNPHECTAAEIKLLEMLGGRFTLALRNAALYESERRASEAFQESLLALPAALDGLQYASAYRAAVQPARVGGDFYHLFELDENRVGVLVGDVSGKGLQAAVLTSLVRDTVRAHAGDKHKAPDEIVRLTNRLIAETTTDEVFVTMFFGVLECRQGHFAYCNAGHTAVALLHPDIGVVPLGSNSQIVGAFDNASFSADEVRFRTGSTLFLYTDGIVEARCEGALFGEERLFNFLQPLAGQEPAEIVEAVMAEVERFSRGAFADDVAMLAVRRLN
ncbi:MAG: MASE3 domain-containing protein [Coriobacteriia bacterium]